MPSPVDGFSIDNTKMNVKNGEYYILYQFGTDHAIQDESGGDITNVAGEKIPLNVLFSTSNARVALAPLLKGLNEMGTLKDGNPQEFNALMYLMLGDEKYKSPDTSTSQDQSFDSAMLSTQVSKDLQSVMAVESNNEYLTAKNAGKGLLGVNLEVTTNMPLPNDPVFFRGKQWSWRKIAGDYLKYGLECEVPGNDYGAISDVALSECAELISEYLTTKTNTIANASEVNVDVIKLVRPILIRMQSDLVKYFTDAYNKHIIGKSSADIEKEEEEQQEAADNAENELFNDNNNSNNNADNTNNSGSADMDEEDYINQLSNAFTSKQISVTLKKITASNELQLLGLQSNYNPTDTLDDLEDAIYQDEFMDILTEAPQTFAITVDDDGYDIEQCEDCITDPCASLCEVFKSGIRAYRNLYILHWMSHGNDMMKLHNLSEEMYEELQSEIDTIGELLVEKQGTVPQLDFPCDYIPVQQYDFQTGLDQIKSLIQMYIDCIDYAYCNQDSDVQSTLDEWLRYWNKQLNYFIKNQEI